MAAYIIVSLIVSAVIVILTICGLNIRWRRISSPPGVVVLCQPGRGPAAPSVSPFALKLETFLRMAGIPYQNRFGMQMSSKGKTPWMVYNGRQVADSQLCIDLLKQEFRQDLNARLTAEENAIGRAFQKLVEENLYWSMCAVTFGPDSGPLRAVLPYRGVLLSAMVAVLQYKLRRQLWYQGMGRHTAAEAETIGRQDVQALSVFMGEKPFVMGEEPCETDCAIFGMLAMIKWHMPGSPHQRMVNEEFPNLSTYCERMKERYWPDWEKCTTSWGTRTASA